LPTPTAQQLRTRETDLPNNHHWEYEDHDIMNMPEMAERSAAKPNCVDSVYGCHDKFAVSSEDQEQDA
jgi:hypothetical protein